jgi:hypothetical protein
MESTDRQMIRLGKKATNNVINEGTGNENIILRNIIKQVIRETRRRRKYIIQQAIRSERKEREQNHGGDHV